MRNVGGTDRGCPTRSSLDCQMSARNSTGLELSNVLRLRQPRSAVFNLLLCQTAA
jgi:hypothetical protein